MTKPLWSDLSDSMARMQGRQMLPLGEYDDALGWVLTMATYRRAAWRAGDSITTPQIAAYFLVPTGGEPGGAVGAAAGPGPALPLRRGL